jgi:hypothetical protein
MAKRIKTNRDDYTDLLNEVKVGIEVSPKLIVDAWVPNKKNAKVGEEHLIGKTELNKARFYVHYRRDPKTEICLGHYRIREGDFRSNWGSKKLTSKELSWWSSALPDLERQLKLKFPDGVPMPGELEDMAELALDPQVEIRPLVEHRDGKFHPIGEVRLEELADGSVQGVFVLEDMTWDEVDLRHLIWKKS